MGCTSGQTLTINIDHLLDTSTAEQVNRDKRSSTNDMFTLLEVSTSSI